LKIINTVILILLVCWTLKAQDTGEKIPVSLRGEKITDQWADRAFVKDGGVKPAGQYLL
jgi:hypothetical protein